MRKTLLIITALALMGFYLKKKNVNNGLLFMGIPMTTTHEQFASNLINKGFKYDESSSDSPIFQGVFFGQKSLIHVANTTYVSTTDSIKYIGFIVVEFQKDSIYEDPALIDNLIGGLTKKYGVPQKTDPKDTVVIINFIEGFSSENGDITFSDVNPPFPYVWQLEDGTIVLNYYNDDDTPLLYYINRSPYKQILKNEIEDL